ncbi:uncharacterized protein LOC127244960 isoform X2 [Andrographis paniculata]|uniref:uncharacterized protein LOC127244960 isoform X2 n=1 Tax=Andrographis paniculata TaxID=175694 RepID=UPI0021E717EA|nr:uncharacterized protein LOC127244960 isoform X2 [Andrographis paniculata]
MFAKLFQKPTQSQLSSQGDPRQIMASPDFAPRVVAHYGIPSTASILGYDSIQRLLAVGTLDGRIKVVGGDNIEALLISPKALPFKNLEFLQNQGFLVSVSNENEIQVWDLEKRCISSSVKWESNITAFSVISGTNYMYAGDEYGFVSVLKYDFEERNILQLPYHVPPNLIAEGAGISLPDHPSIVGVLSQPCSSGNRMLIAFQDGLIILWDATEDKAIHIRSNKDLQLQKGTVVNFANNESQTCQTDILEDEEVEKEISSLCWVSSEGSVLAVGYVDGDILLWDLSVPENDKGQRTEKAHVDVVKVQKSSGDRRLPVIFLRWSSNNEHSCGGQLFAYGGEDIGSEEVLTILDLDWSSGLSKLKCSERVDLRLDGSFADVLVMPNAYNAKNNKEKSLFVLTNPGQLHYYAYVSVSALKPERGKDHSAHTLQYQSVIPTLEPYMTVGKLFVIDSERNNLNALSQHYSESILAGEGTKWPITGGVPYQKAATSCCNIERIYIGGYQDGSVRIWDTTFPVVSLVSTLGFEATDFQELGGSVAISALDLCHDNLTLAIGNESGTIFLCRLQGNTNQPSVTVVTDTKQEVHQYKPEEKSHCDIIYSILNTCVRALHFATSGDKLIAGFESGQVALFDITSPSVLFVMDCDPSTKSPVISLAVDNLCYTHDKESNDMDAEAEKVPGTEIVFALTRDARLILIDSSNCNTINSQPICLKENSTAISMHLIENKHSLAEACEVGDENSSLNRSILSGVKEGSQILLCCEEDVFLYPLKSLIQGENSLIHELRLEQPCSWASTFKRDEEKHGLILVYQNGYIEIRYFPELKPLGRTSMTSILRWNFKNNMDKTMSASKRGQITVVNGCEFAFVSILAYENEFRIPETLPCLHDKAVAAAADPDLHFGVSQKKPQGQSHLPGFFSNVIKGLKGRNGEQDLNYSEAREAVATHLEKIFSRFPFSSSYDLDDMELEIDDVITDDAVFVEVNDPVPPSSSSSQKSHSDTKEKEDERARLFEGSSTDAKPKLRTREEIIAKYRGGDAASAAAQARDKLLERQEKLEKLSRDTEELQSGAENFASLAQQIAKNMEKRKWWHL